MSKHHSFLGDFALVTAVSQLVPAHCHFLDIRYLGSNQLTALDVSLFDKNKALGSLYVGAKEREGVKKEVGRPV